VAYSQLWQIGKAQPGPAYLSGLTDDEAYHMHGLPQ